MRNCNTLTEELRIRIDIPFVRGLYVKLIVNLILLAISQVEIGVPFTTFMHTLLLTPRRVYNPKSHSINTELKASWYEQVHLQPCCVLFVRVYTNRLLLNFWYFNPLCVYVCVYQTWGQILLKVFKYKYKYFLKYLNTNTNTNTYFSMYLNTNTNTFGKYLNTNTNTLYKLNMIKQCMLIW